MAAAATVSLWSRDRPWVDTGHEETHVSSHAAHFSSPLPRAASPSRLEATLGARQARYTRHPHHDREQGGEKGEYAPALAQIREGVGQLLQAQRTVHLEAESLWAKLEEHGRRLEAEIAVLLDRVVGMPRGSGAHEAETATAELGAQPTDKLQVRPELLAGEADLPSPEQDADMGQQDLPGRSASEGTVNYRRNSSKVSQILRDDMLTEMAAAANDGQTRQEGWYVKAIHSTRFDLLVGCFIVANCVVMSTYIEYTGWKIEQDLFGHCVSSTCASTWPEAEVLFLVLEQFFTAAFCVELLLRLFADGFGYFKSRANLGDAFIVIVSCLDAWVLTPLGGEAFSNIAILRLLRVVRLAKVLRVVRVMKAFKSLRVLVSAVAASASALAWSMILLFVLELIGANFLAQVLQPVIEDEEKDLEVREFLWRRFGTWTSAMFSIFEVTMAPGGFIQYRRLEDDVHPLIGVFLMFYVCVVTFAVVRVITAMFLKATLSASDQDEARTVSLTNLSREEYAHRLSQKVDADGSGGIDRGELKEWLTLPRMQDWMKDIGLSMPDAERLFTALDPGVGEIMFNEFVDALKRMKSNPRPSDVVITHIETRSILSRLKRMERAMGVRTPRPWRSPFASNGAHEPPAAVEEATVTAAV